MVTVLVVALISLRMSFKVHILDVYLEKFKNTGGAYIIFAFSKIFWTLNATSKEHDRKLYLHGTIRESHLQYKPVGDWFARFSQYATSVFSCIRGLCG